MIKLEAYFKSGYSVINLITSEEIRAEKEILSACKAIKRKLTVWSTTEGFTQEGKSPRSQEDPVEALTEILKDPTEDIVYIFRDLHQFFQGQGGTKVCRLIRDIARIFKEKNKTLVIISAVNKLMPEMERDVTLLEFDLPDEATLTTIWDNLAEKNQLKKLFAIDENERDMIIQAARGLTTTEAENAFSKAVVDCAAIKKDRPKISKLVMTEKAIAVRKSGILEYFEASETMLDVGGLATLKKWLGIRKSALTKKARQYGLPQPKGALFVGIPGCGKSLAAKAAANAFGVPLIRFDISKVFAGLVGMSEANMRNALQTIDAIGNCVVWMDELEKGLAGMGGGGSNDSGVSTRVFGSFLTWLQEKKSSSFVVATINRIDGLPPELIRKGRWDEIFYVGLPSAKEREEIFKIHILKDRRPVEMRNTPWMYDIKDFRLNGDGELLEKSNGFSGAEIEAAVISGLFSAFSKSDGEKPMTSDHILSAVLNTTPLSTSRKGDLDAMAKWAEENAVDASGEEDGSDPLSKALGVKRTAGRKLVL
jgi:ATP-dependent 26S proteasome regulatory subunit